MATRAAFAPSAGRVRPKPRRVPTRAASYRADGADGGGGGAPRVEPSFQRSVPPGDARERDVCTTCGFVDYRNPKVVVGSVAVWVDPGSPEGSPPTEKILLCKRGIEPRIGKWGLPQGFMELGETSREGAAREAFEESGASIIPGVLLSVYNLPGQVQLLYAATIAGGTVDDATGEHAPPTLTTDGTESLEAGYFTYDEIAGMDDDELAFPTVRWGIDYWRANYSRVAGFTRTGRAVQPQQRVKRWPPVEGEPGFVDEVDHTY